MNAIKTAFLMSALTALMILAGGALGGRQGLIVAFVLAGITNLGSYWFSDKIVLKMYRAREIQREEDPELYDIVSELASRAGLPMPKVYILPQSTPNAFATGRNPKHAAVAVTEGIRRMLNNNELAGVLGHELAHVQHRDILIGSIAAVIAGAITFLASMARWTLIFGGSSRDNRRDGNALAYIVMMILAPIAAMLIQMAISRSREYSADARGAKISGNPVWLASALRKLQIANRQIPMKASPSTAHMFIMNPLTFKGIQSLFSTHPSTEERIARLEQMAAA
ncbi:zinc metalloprotease HtpX [bacterium]|nr:zinc metalloprotease HtpX [bacterium]